MTVQESIIVDENLGPANIPLSLDQSSCLPITIIAHPQIRTATG